MSAGPARNPLHRLIDVLTCYERALWRVHHAATTEQRNQALDGWRVCHPLAWQGRPNRDDAIRELADPAKAWLSAGNSRYVGREDFDLVEECASAVSGFAVSPSPMSMPHLYSEMGTPRKEQWREWNRQGEGHRALSGLIARLRELAARAGEAWAPRRAAEESEGAGGPGEADQAEAGPAQGTGAGSDQPAAEQGEGAGGAKLSPSRLKAFQQYQWAVSSSAELQGATDRQVYEWLREHLDQGESLPAFATWTRYLSEARAAHDSRKYSPRAGRETGRSIVRPDEI
jgi:hypothetical protein